MYTSHFGLTEIPFMITPDPRYLFMGGCHREAMAHLLYGIFEHGGFVQLTGEVGTGKTTLCRALLEQLPPEIDVALLWNPRLTGVELLAAVCDELRIAYPPGTSSLKMLIDVLYQHLLEAHRQGRRTVLIIDEAQNLTADVLEEIRLLTNLETAQEKLLQVILIGQPELCQLLERPELRQVAQRITARYHLHAFAVEESRAYIVHRVKTAGGGEMLFTPGALRSVHRWAGGVPRLINILCDRALLGTYTQGKRYVDARTVRRATREVQAEEPQSPARHRGLWLAGVASLAAALSGAWMWTMSVGSNASLPTQVERVALTTSVQESPTIPPPPPALVVTPPLVVPQQSALRLVDVLADPSVARDKATALVSLYGRWGIDYRDQPSDFDCEREVLAGLRCLVKTGTWSKLRRLNLPAILTLVTTDSTKHYATLTSLVEDAAALDFGGRQFTFPLSQLERVWDGSFIILWKAPPVRALPLVAGMRGRDVEWLRQRLGEFDGMTVTGSTVEVFDAELANRVRRFQRSRALVSDGIVGEETMVHLSTAIPDAGAPLLASKR
jgi:general secretion pathway protein A